LFVASFIAASASVNPNLYLRRNIMAFFDDMTTALETYPVANVTLEIIEVDFPGSALNARDEGTFRVRINNNGPLELTDVALKISGQNGATVANNGAAAVFVPEFVTQTNPVQQVPTVSGHNGSVVTTGSPMKFKAPNGEQASKTLIKVTLEGWNANLNHILNGHSDPLPVAPKGTFAAAVEPR
jgi:hypothetical protein